MALNSHFFVFVKKIFFQKELNLTFFEIKLRINYDQNGKKILGLYEMNHEL